jgi:hypothetical protein
MAAQIEIDAGSGRLPVAVRRMAEEHAGPCSRAPLQGRRDRIRAKGPRVIDPGQPEGTLDPAARGERDPLIEEHLHPERLEEVGHREDVMVAENGETRWRKDLDEGPEEPAIKPVFPEDEVEEIPGEDRRIHPLPSSAPAGKALGQVRAEIEMEIGSMEQFPGGRARRVPPPSPQLPGTGPLVDPLEIPAGPPLQEEPPQDLTDDPGERTPKRFSRDPVPVELAHLRLPLPPLPLGRLAQPPRR